MPTVLYYALVFFAYQANAILPMNFFMVVSLV